MVSVWMDTLAQRVEEDAMQAAADVRQDSRPMELICQR